MQDSTKVVVTNSGSGSVSIINAANGNAVTTIPVGSNPQFVAIPPFTVPSDNSQQILQQAEAVAQQNLQLVDATIASSLQQVQETGMMSATQGTFADTVNPTIIDSSTPY